MWGQDVASGQGSGKVQRCHCESCVMPRGGLTHHTFICSGSACFIAQQSCERALEEGIFSPRHLKEHSKSSLYLSPFLLSCCHTALFSFTPEVKKKKKRLFSAAQECNNTSFFWSGYCVCLPGFKLLSERHFRGHHTVLSMKDSQMLTSSPEGLRLCLFFFFFFTSFIPQ